jgi:TP901 family phage tail tape measure protein
MSDDGHVRIVVEGDVDSLVREMRRGGGALTLFGRQAQIASRNSGALGAMWRQQHQTLGQLTNGVQRLSVVIGGLAVGGMVHLLKTGAAFEQQMARVKAVTKASAADMQSLNALAIKLGQDTKYSAGQAAEAMYELASAGYDAKGAAQALPGVLSLAASSNIDLASAAEISSNALQGFGLKATQSTHVADVMAEAVNRSSLELVDLQLSMKYVAAAGSATGQSIETMTAALSVMANAGIKGEQGGTSLRAGLLRLVKPTKMVEKGFTTLGISATDLQGPKGLKSLPEIMALLSKHADHLTVAQRNTALAQIFGTEAFSGMMKVYQAGPKKLEALTRAYEQSNGAAKRAATTMNSTVAGAFENLTGSIQTVEITLFQHFQQPLRKALLDAAQLVNREGKVVQDWLDRVTSTPEFKAADLRGRVQILLHEVGQAVERGDLSNRFATLFSDGLNAALPVVVKAGEHAGTAFAKGMAKAFMGADPLGRLLIAGYLSKKLGLFSAWGKLAGREFSGGFAPAAVQGATGGTLATSGFKANMLSFGKQAGIAAGLGFAVAYGPEVAKYLSRDFSTKSAKYNLPKDQGPVGSNIGKILGGAAAGPIGLAVGLFADKQVGPATDTLRKFGDTAEEAFKKAAQAGNSGALLKLAEQARGLQREYPKAAGALQRFVDDVDTALQPNNTKWAKEIDANWKLATQSTGTNLAMIRHTVDQNLGVIRDRMDTDSDAGRKALSDNFKRAAEAIKTQMGKGAIGTKAGTALIRQYIMDALKAMGLTGNQAESVLHNGTLSNDSASGSKAETAARRSKGAAVGGFWLGRRGEKGRDSVAMDVNGQPVLAARGEYVAIMNDHQQQAFDQIAAQAGYGGMAGFFGAHNRPHGMASGGTVDSTGTVKRAMFPTGMGAVSTLGQTGLDRVRGRAQQLLDSVGVSAVGGPSGSGNTANMALGRALMLAMGMGPEQWPALKALWIGESGWNENAVNSSSGAGGIPQALPASKMGPGWQGNARQQILWGLNYIRGRYGTPAAAYAAWMARSPHWYTRGGVIRASGGAAFDSTGQPAKPTKTTTAKKPAAHPAGKRHRYPRLKVSLPSPLLGQINDLDDQIGLLDGTTIPQAERDNALTDENQTITGPDGTQIRDEAGITQHAAEIDRIITYRKQIRDLLSKQQDAVIAAHAMLWSGIREREKRTRQIKERIAANLRERRRLLDQLHAEHNKKGGGSKTRKHDLTTRIKTLENENVALGGEAAKTGDGGQLGQARQGLDIFKRQLTDVDAKGGALTGALEDNRLDIAELLKERNAWTGTTVSLSDTIGSASSMSATEGDLAELYRQQAQDALKNLALTNAQFDVFKGAAPMIGDRLIGKYAHGVARVPETGLALLHRDETVLTDPQGPYGNQISPYASQGPSADPVVNVQIHVAGDTAQLFRIVDARVDGRAARVVSEQLGRRARRLTVAPGGN